MVVDPSVSDELTEYAKKVQRDFGMEHPPPLPDTEASWARKNQFELTVEECKLTVLGRAWEIKNKVKFIWHLDTGDEDVSHQEWPADLRANGLTATYDSRGRVRPRTSTFGKYFRMENRDTYLSWHRVVGAYIGFAIGDALGSAVDTLTWPEIQKRHGPRGITDFATAFDRPGQISALTQQLLFLTEGAIRAVSKYRKRDEPETLDPPGAIRDALFRWAYTQGVPWGKLAGASTEAPDGWLVEVDELHRRRAPAPGLLDTIRALAAPPDEQAADAPAAASFVALVSGLASGIPNMTIHDEMSETMASLCHRDPVDLAATFMLSWLYKPVLYEKEFVNPVWLTLMDHWLDKPTVHEREKPEFGGFFTLLRKEFAKIDPRKPNVNWDYVPGVAEIDGIGSGTDATSVLVRALISLCQFEGDPRNALLTAVNHSGRSAMTGAIVGSIVGARYGVPGLPQDWVEQLELRDLIESLASDTAWHFAIYKQQGFDDDEWDKRYPPHVAADKRG